MWHACNAQTLSARVKFMIRDILELRKSKWVPRRQKEEAKKISEIHAAAHAELGMLPPKLTPGLLPLPGLARGAQPGLPAADDAALFPAFKSDSAFYRSPDVMLRGEEKLLFLVANLEPIAAGSLI